MPEAVMALESAAVPPWRELIANAGYWRWSAAVQLVRLPPLMSSLAFVLAGSYVTGTHAVGGLMVTVFVVSRVCFAPMAGRALDRLGSTTGVPGLLGLAGLALCALAAAVAIKASTLLLLLLAGVAGVLGSGAGSGMRTVLSHTVPQRLLAPALAIDATVLELVVVTAPFLVALTATTSPAGAIFAMAAATGAAALLVRRLPVQPSGRSRPGIPAAGAPDTVEILWRNPRIVFWMVSCVAFGHAIGTAETGALPLAQRLGGGERDAVLLLTVLAVTSALSGLTYAGLSHRIPLRPTMQASFLLAVMAAACAGLWVSRSWLGAAVAMAVLGACTAPFGAVQSQAVELEAPPTRKAEAFGMVAAAHGLGFALGGLFLAVLPLGGMLLAGGASAVVSLTLAPMLMRARVNQAGEPAP